ncbi:uvrABC system protein B [Deinococcus xinjiangensis]|uniref:UvrABC system protein B n=1 Tax=Deinococcus xinjiangensis TaxID=457454 RepID=A0ABP9VF46_9DEIO
MSNFAFLQEWPDLFPAAAMAESYVRGDPRTATFHARRSLEQLVDWLFTHDPDFTPRPYDRTLNALLRSDAYMRNVPSSVQPHADIVRREGNLAVHGGREVTPQQAMATLRDLWYFANWFAWEYTAQERRSLPADFSEALVPQPSSEVARLTREQVEALSERLSLEQAEREALQGQLADSQARLAALQAQVKARKARTSPLPPSLASSEKATRERLIDVLLREAGWEPGDTDVREYPVTGMPVGSGNGFVDYVLWGHDGLPLALVEAKKTSVNAEDGRQQAKLYADALEARFGRRPVIFYSNGIKTFLWDDDAFPPAGGYPPREVAGFYTRDELELLIQRRKTRLPLSDQSIDSSIVERVYQHKAIRAFTERLEVRQRRGLLVMATGTGKTRTAAAIIELLQRAGWVKRVLFLADRQALVKQTVGVFKKFIPGGVHNLLDGQQGADTARVVVSTYHTMLNVIESAQVEGGEKLFGPGHFDLVIVDEAHRSIYRNFSAIFRYFDAYLLGLTATPRDEVDRNTYRLFDMEDGVPLYSYSLEEAVQDGYLVPPRGRDATPAFLQRGIRYADLSEEEKDDYDQIDWEEVGGRREEITSGEINQWLFNKDTVDKVLQDVMESGVKIQGGDVLGKTIVFAANHRHALYIVERFEANFPHLHNFARVIDNYDRYAGTLIDDFSDPTQQPTIAVSVDMLDTGIDVPEVVNLVLFKVVRSKTKFMQMVGRGTRLRPNLFGPGRDKQFFNVLDYCGNLQFFSLNPEGFKSEVSEPILQRTFKKKLELLRVLAPRRAHDPEALTLYQRTADELHARVQGIPLQSFMVRQWRDVVEKYLERSKWDALTDLDHTDLARVVSGLPSSVQTGDEGARRFDHLISTLQLATVSGSKDSPKLQRRLQKIAENLSLKGNIPDVQAQMGLLNDVQSDEKLAAMTVSQLSDLRAKLRDLVSLIDLEERGVVFTDFEDQLTGSDTEFFPDLGSTVNVAQYRKKIELFLREQESHPVIRKIRQAQPLTAEDLKALETLLFQASPLESRGVFEEVYGQQPNLASFIRSLVGLDRETARQVFGHYLNDQVFNLKQIQFVETLIDLLTRSGSVAPRMLYEPPFTNADPNGLDGLFNDEDAHNIVSLLRQINRIEVSAA